MQLNESSTASQDHDPTGSVSNNCSTVDIPVHRGESKGKGGRRKGREEGEGGKSANLCEIIKYATVPKWYARPKTVTHPCNTGRPEIKLSRKYDQWTTKPSLFCLQLALTTLVGASPMVHPRLFTANVMLPPNVHLERVFAARRYASAVHVVVVSVSPSVCLSQAGTVPK